MPRRMCEDCGIGAWQSCRCDDDAGLDHPHVPNIYREKLAPTNLSCGMVSGEIPGQRSSFRSGETPHDKHELAPGFPLPGRSEDSIDPEHGPPTDPPCSGSCCSDEGAEGLDEGGLRPQIQRDDRARRDAA